MKQWIGRTHSFSTNKITIAFMPVFYSSVAMASETMAFKPEFSPKISWFNYGLAIIILLIIIFFIAKKHKPGLMGNSACQLLEKKYLGNKTVVYIIEYQQQRFLLADNQQALALHPLKLEETNEHV